MHSVSYGISGAWGWKDLYAEVGSYNMFGKSGIESTSVWYGGSYSGTQTQLGNLRVYSMGIPQTLILLLIWQKDQQVR